MAISMLKDGKITPLEEERDDVSPHTEPEGEEQPQDAAELLKNSPPEDPLAAAIDKATGFADAAKADATEEAEGFSEKERAANRPGTEKRNWVEEAYKCFIKDVGDIDPTDPEKAIEVYFQKNATDELKARCKAEGKDAKGCWKFIEAVARKALGNRSGHIDPGVVYAIAMHWFEDVPKDWDKKAEHSSAVKSKPKAKKATNPKQPTSKKIEKLEEKVVQSQVSVARKKELKKELAEAKRKERAKAAKAARPDTRKKKPRAQQGFFFEMLETPVTAPEATASGAKQESEVQG